MASVEGLLSEVTAILGSRLAVRAADQAFFKDKQVYTDVSTAAASTSGGSSDKKCDVHSAIESAKQTINQALAGQVPTPSSGSNDKVFAEISALKKENVEIKAELAELRKLLKGLSINGAQLLFSGDSRILILGDGNLSFSLSMARMYPNRRITATVLESEEDFSSRYRADDVLMLLRKCPNILVLFGIDATQLPIDWYGRYDDIIMNFPHPGGKTNLMRSRILASNIFASVKKIMKSSTELHFSLARGQSGLRSIDIENVWSDDLPLHDKDSWQIIYIAATEGLEVKRTLPFYPMLFPEYYSSGYKSTCKGFNNWNCAQRMVLRIVDDHSYDSLRSLPMGLFRFNTLLPFYLHDISILFQKEEDNQLVATMIRELAGSMIPFFWELEELRAICPKPCLPNRIYRLCWQPRSAIGKKKCNQYQEEFRRRITQYISTTNSHILLV